MDMRQIYRNGILGVVVGDALGLPVQFAPRAERDKNPVGGMLGYGVFDMPAGSWSDDSSLTLAALDTMNKFGYDPTQIMNAFDRWLFNGDYTPFGEAYDIGRTCMLSIENYHRTHDFRTCGLRTAEDNGNGSLMRIMPFVLHGYEMKLHGEKIDDITRMIHEASAFTHAHNRAKMACGVYYFIAVEILEAKRTGDTRELAEIICDGGIKAMEYYGKKPEFRTEMEYFKSCATNIGAIDRSLIRSTGYVVDSLEAALWALASTNNYRDCALKCVNLGLDTDSIAAIAGGLAGLYYGEKNIPENWIDDIQRKNWIMDMCNR